MNNRIDAMEQRLTRLYQDPTPDEAFAACLEQELRIRVPRTRARSTSGFWSKRWAVPASLVIFTVMIVALLGPPQVWAAIQGWIGFIPHFGFTQVENQLVLAEPVTVSNGAVRITIDQVTSGDRFTSLVFTLKGQRFSEQQLQEKVGLLLRLPDGTSLEADHVYVYWGGLNSLQGQVLFPALPGDARAVSLEVAATANPDLNLSIPLRLRRAARPGFDNAYIEPHVPENAIATTHGVTLTVTQAVYGPDAAVFELEIESPWSLPSWVRGVDPHTAENDGQATLRDQTGFPYSRFYSALPPYRQQAAHIYTFVPVRPEAESLELHIPLLTFRVPVTETLYLRFGDDPQMGQEWPLDVQVEAAGIQAHITGVTLVQNSPAYYAGDEPCVLRFTVSSRVERGNRRLCTLYVDGYRSAPSIKELRCADDVTESEFSIALPDLPSGDMKFDLSWLEFVLEGPWEITWDLP